MARRTAPILAGSLIGGYVAAEGTKNRNLGGVVLIIGGLVALRRWIATVGVAKAVLLSVIYFLSFAVSHPLAKKIGAWPSVFAVAGAAGGAAHLIADRSQD